ncbi:MAG: magnesium transporter CorA family protein [Vagococcus sp.]
MLLEHELNKKVSWIETRELNEHEKNVLLNQYEIPLEMLDYVTDIYEQSNYIYDADNEIQLVIIHIPSRLSSQDKYITRPVSFLIRDNQLFTFNEGGTNETNENLKKDNADKQEHSPTMFMLDSLNSLVKRYFPVLREITKERHKLDDLLTQRLTNKDLIKLSSLQQTLTFFLSATESNTTVFEMIDKSIYGRHFSDVEKERLDDVMIEAQQVAHMTSLEVKIINKISQIFDSIMNNNLNDTMRFLTVWSLALAIPTLITGFFGMNIKLPTLDQNYGWIYLVILSVILIVWLILGLKRRRKM